jgi:dTDP-4-dehydrorhamnose 3,5-epimerase
LVISEVAEFEYKCTDIYDPDGEFSVAWNDPDIGINWPIQNPTLSDKDANAPRLCEVTDRLVDF